MSEIRWVRVCGLVAFVMGCGDGNANDDMRLSRPFGTDAPLAPIQNTLPALLTFGPSRDKNEMSTIYLMTLGAREWCIR
jgi:hypothetical protein